MTTSRRDLLTAALTAAAGVAVRPELAGGQEPHHDHDMSIRPFRPTPPFASKRSSHCLVAKGLVIPRRSMPSSIPTSTRSGRAMVPGWWLGLGWIANSSSGSWRTARPRWPSWATVGDTLTVVENTAQVHNLVVCTLCSCYPWADPWIAAGLV